MDTDRGVRNQTTDTKLSTPGIHCSYRTGESILCSYDLIVLVSTSVSPRPACPPDAPFFLSFPFFQLSKSVLNNLKINYPACCLVIFLKTNSSPFALVRIPSLARSPADSHSHVKPRHPLDSCLAFAISSTDITPSSSAAMGLSQRTAGAPSS